MESASLTEKIVKLFLTLLGICILNAGYTFAEDGFRIDKELVRASELYKQRENRESLTLAVEIYENISKHIPQGETSNNNDRAEALVALSRCCFKLASYHTKSNKEKAAWYEKGEGYGRKAVQTDPSNVGGYYWMAQNIGEHGSISKLYFLNRKSEFEDALKKAELLDNPQEPYDYAGIYRTLTAYHTPRFLWGNLEKALEYAKKMEDSPRYLCNLSVLADLYWKTDKKKAEGYAKQIVNADISRYPETQFENSIEQKEVAGKWSLQ